jgi:hypothetical protein
MKKIIMGAALLSGAAVAFASPAYADDAAFVTHVKAIGISASSDNSLATIGHIICQDIGPGGTYTRESEAQDLVASSRKGHPNAPLDIGVARQEVSYAISDICPQNANRP